MQDVGENMDELFRKAADNYMLKEGEDNWSEISGRLKPSVRAALPGKTKKYLASGFLLLLCFAAGVLFNQYTSENIPAVTATTNQEIDKAGNKTVDKTVKAGGKSLLEYKAAHTEAGRNINLALKRHITAGLEKQAGRLTESYSAFELPIYNNTKHIMPVDSFLVHCHGIEEITGKAENLKVKFEALQTAGGSKIIPLERLHFTSDSVKNNDPARLSVKSKEWGVYYGLAAGIGFNSVKSQGYTKPGFDLGPVGGYDFNKRSSIEIGLLYSNKYYYSDGKYFNMDKMAGTMPAGMKLMSVKANSSIFEIPVKFKYNLLRKNYSTVYAAAGESSYILVNEKNDYEISMNGTMGTMKNSYRKTTGYFAAAINISAGYEHRIGNNNTIRFEPYIVIPTKGIGIGRLPVTTSGVHVLFTISAHK